MVVLKGKVVGEAGESGHRAQTPNSKVSKFWASSAQHGEYS